MIDSSYTGPCLIIYECHSLQTTLILGIYAWILLPCLSGDKDSSRLVECHINPRNSINASLFSHTEDTVG